MQTYLSGSPVELAIPIADDYGNPLAFVAIEMRLVDGIDTEHIARTEIAGLSGSEQEVLVRIESIHNELAAGEVQAARVVELYVRQPGGSVILLSRSYRLAAANGLLIPKRSFVSYAGAEMIALETVSMQAWEGASRPQREAALIEARERLCRLRYAVTSLEASDWQSRVSYSDEPIDLASFEPGEFLLTLSLDFREALARAQVIEANEILGGDPIARLRESGLMRQTVGESSQIYRNSKAARYPVCPRALSVISRYVRMSIRLGRG
jgi:hypothetical protein